MSMYETRLTKPAAFLGDAGNSGYRFVVSHYYWKTELDKNGVFQRIFELSGGFLSCPEDFRVVLLDHFLTLFLCSFWYKSTGIKKKWSQFRITHFLKRLFGAIWLFETRFRAWNNFYMDHSTDTPTHPSTQYRNALGIRSRTTSRITRTTSRITRTTSYMHLESVSSSLWRNSVTSENQFKPVPATPKKAAGFVFAFLTCSS